MILNGKDVAKATLIRLKNEVGSLSRPPGLAVVRVGEDPASQLYVKRKTERAKRLGYHQRTIVLPENASQSQLLDLVDELNQDPQIDGILVQLPLPRHLNEDDVLQAISAEKDVDGFHASNAGMLSQGRPYLVPCTPKGVMRLIEAAGLDTEGREAVVVGRSNIVGRPIAQLLEQANCTVTVCHSRTQNLASHLGRADIVVAAVGRPKMIKGEWIKPGAVVIDVGINRLDDGTICGDVDYETAKKVASAITPVPGGVGPMTISMLMENTFIAAKARQAL